MKLSCSDFTGGWSSASLLAAARAEADEPPPRARREWSSVADLAVAPVATPPPAEVQAEDLAPVPDPR